MHGFKYYYSVVLSLKSFSEINGVDNGIMAISLQCTGSERSWETEGGWSVG